MRKGLFRKRLAGILTAAIVFGMFPGIGNVPAEVQAKKKVKAKKEVSGEAEVRKVNLNVKQTDGYRIAGIKDPKEPQNQDSEWSGSKVYFGSYESKPLLFRVLDANTTDYSKEDKDGNKKSTMFLDSDAILEKIPFNSKNLSNKWSESDINVWMNSAADAAGSNVTNSDGQAIPGFMHDFVRAERNAIAYSSRTETGGLGQGQTGGSWCPVGNSVFALDAKEASASAYGYSDTGSDTKTRVKSGSGGAAWWMRTAAAGAKAGYVNSAGSFDNADAGSKGIGVSPALNLDLSKVLFTTADGVDKTTPFAEIKETADGADKDIHTWNLTLESGTQFNAGRVGSNYVGQEVENGGRVSVYVTYVSNSVSDPYTQISAMLVDHNHTVIAYGKVKDKVEQGFVDVPLPDNLTEGADYTVKVFAENVRSSASAHFTDYTSSVVSIPLTVEVPQPEDTRAIKDINLNSNGSIAGIANPKRPETPTEDDWSGSKVYFGSYENNPVLFRVLDANTTDYGTDATMFLDCDSVLKQMNFSAMGVQWDVWQTSELRKWMNQESEDGFLNGFTDLEKSTIVKSARSDSTGLGNATRFDWSPLSGEKVFALDAKEAANAKYGYSNYTDGDTKNREKSAAEERKHWWLRSISNEINYQAGSVSSAGNMGPWSVTPRWASPALNLNLSSILLTSASGKSKSSDVVQVGADGTAANMWEMTLLDKDKTVGVIAGKKAKKDGNIVTVPYTYTGNDINQISIMITTAPYTEKSAEVLYYGKLRTETTFQAAGGNGEGTFTMPEGLPDTAKIYILAEDVNDGNYTDYASKPALVGAIEEAEKPAAKVAAPKADLKENSYTENKAAGLSTTTTDAEIYYTITTDGTEPDVPTKASTPYTDKIALTGVPGSEIVIKIKAIAVKSGMQDSDVSGFTYTIELEVPKYAVAVTKGTGDGKYKEGKQVTIAADAPAQGKRFKEWAGTDGLTFTDGTDKTSVTATFTMPARDVNVTAIYEDIPHEHKWDTGWTYNDGFHWHKCTAPGCNGSVKDKAEHTEGEWIIDKDATTTEEGSRHTECTICGKKMQTEAIPKTEGPVLEDPAITGHPKDVSVKAGETATFKVTATGTTPLAYQWKVDRNDGKGFVIIEGATDAVYTTSALDKASDGFRYVCVVTNSKGSVSSQAALLKVKKDSKPQENRYLITEGANQTIQEKYNGTIMITCDGDISKFVSVSVDGEVVDSRYYTVESGPTILTFSKEYLTLLSAGKHTVYFTYNDGYAETLLTVQEKEPEEPVSPAEPTEPKKPQKPEESQKPGSRKNPKTGDYAQIAELCVLLLASVSGMIILLGRRKKEKQ